MAVSAGYYHTVGLRSDGTVVAVGGNPSGQRNVGDWRLFQSVDTLEEEQEERRKRREEARKQEEQRRAEQKARRIAQLQQQRADVQSELANLKGLFTGKRRREIVAQLTQIEKELKGLN